jgi:hypothetical protein
MSDALVPDSGAVPRSIAQWTFVDRILVERDDLAQAIEALRLLDSDTIIIKTLKTMDSPLARTHYCGLAERWAGSRPSRRPSRGPASCE